MNDFESVRFMYSGRKICVSCDIDEGDEDFDYGNWFISVDKLELVECIWVFYGEIGYYLELDGSL